MEIRTLRYFLAAAREENMSRAAEILHVTQPTLSKQMKALEEELGKKLFTRHSFSIRL
ncbi:MAG: LysR family transcriptional regulator, partial [Lachnospiraceae bacterium]|nr:LysR family transcriptional regulator [Lachnospiraceae bacterium]